MTTNRTLTFTQAAQAHERQNLIHYSMHIAIIITWSSFKNTEHYYNLWANDM